MAHPQGSVNDPQALAAQVVQLFEAGNYEEAGRLLGDLAERSPVDSGNALATIIGQDESNAVNIIDALRDNERALNSLLTDMIAHHRDLAATLIRAMSLPFGGSEKVVDLLLKVNTPVAAGLLDTIMEQEGNAYDAQLFIDEMRTKNPTRTADILAATNSAELKNY